MAKHQKNDRKCPVCGRKFRLKRKRGKPRKYCSEKCYKIAHRKRVDRRTNLGTESTLSLSPKSIKYQLYLIRNNIDKNARKQFNSDKSKRDIMLDKLVYDEKDFIREVCDNE